jgi:hypothetical protein
VLDLEIDEAHISVTHANKKQFFFARDVCDVRCSRRIAKLCVCYEDKKATDKALGKDKELEKAHEKDKNKKRAKALKNILKKTFTAEVISSDSPLAPKLPISIVQSIGTKQ